VLLFDLAFSNRCQPSKVPTGHIPPIEIYRAYDALYDFREGERENTLDTCVKYIEILNYFIIHFQHEVNGIYFIFLCFNTVYKEIRLIKYWLKTLSMNNRRTIFIIFLFRNTHLWKSWKWCNHWSTNPWWIFSIMWTNYVYIHFFFLIIHKIQEIMSNLKNKYI
jgi:hypothetical protein